MNYQEALDKATERADKGQTPEPWLAIARELREAERARQTSDASPIWSAQERAMAKLQADRQASAVVELGKLRTRYAALISDLEGIVASGPPGEGTIKERHLNNVIRLFKDGS